MANWLTRQFDHWFKTTGDGSSSSPHVLHVNVDGIAAAAVGVALTDNSIDSATGASQVIFAANAAAKVRIIYNSGIAAWYINLAGGTAANDKSAITLQPGDMLVLHNTNAITGLGTSTDNLAAYEGA